MPPINNDRSMFYCFLIRLCSLFKNYIVAGDTPPPFPAKDNSVSSDDGSEESDDLFATKKSTKHSISNTIYKSNYDNESDEDDNRHIKETGKTIAG